MRRAVTRRRGLAWLLVVGALAHARPAAAQQCHQLGGNAWRNSGLYFGVRLEAAGYRNSRFEGDYEGVAPAISFNHRRFSLLALLPMYRLTRNGPATYGLGDLALAARIPVPQWATHHFSAGFGLAATFPTGDDERDLGMGHVMVMPDFWWAHEHGRVQFQGTVGFGRALAGQVGHTHHASGPRPIVNPMNMAEIEGSLVTLLQVHRSVWLRASVYGAMPVGTVNPNGVTRVMLSQGLVVQARGVEVALELQAPLAGQPYLARGVLQVGYRFDVKPRRKTRG